MNAISKPSLSFNLAFNFLQELVFDAVDEFQAKNRRFDASDISEYIEDRYSGRIVAYVKTRCDWPAVVYNDLLMTREQIVECDADPSRFPAVVDGVLLDHFKNLLEWNDDITSILVRSSYIKADDPEPYDIEKPARVRAYVYPQL